MAAAGRCVNGTLDESSYSSPIPVIGLYIASATMVCLLLMLLDIVSGFLSRKRWLPCRFFSLNSITLILLAVAAKLTVDLTSAMPSNQDQLSKLSSTTLVCISMGFLMPSLGVLSDSECFTNIVALSILVITIIVNIGLQMSTGVIFSFHIEHILILCSMWVLLILLWFSTLKIKSHKEVSTDHNKGIIIKGRDSMLQRLKLCYLNAYNFNAQFVQCKHSNSATVGVLCLFCLLILVEAMFRNGSESCGGVSDYAWSMKIIFMTQFTTVIIGSLGVILRSVALVSYMEFSRNSEEEVSKIIMDSPFLGNKLQDWFPITLKQKMEGLMDVFSMIMFTLSFSILKVIEMFLPYGIIYLPQDRADQTIREFKELIHEGEMGLQVWTLRKGVQDMMRCINMFKKGTSCHLKDLLSRNPPSHDESDSLANKLKQRFDSNERYEMSSLSVVLLVSIATISLPPNLSGSLTDTLSEVFETIHFVDGKMNSISLRNKNKSRLAKFVWKAKDFNSFVLEIIEKSTNGVIQTQTSLERAIGIIRELKSALPSNFVWDELGVIADFIINSQVYETIEDLHRYIEKLYVDMLNEFLAQLPNAIFREIIESHPEDFEKKLRVGLKLLCQIESVEPYIQWSFPIGSNITDLISREDPIIDIENSTVVEVHADDAVVSPPVTNGVESNASSTFTSSDEIVMQV